MGADHPPPPGFLWIILIDALSSLVVYFRINSYINWSKSQKKGRFLLVLLDGSIAGFVIALFMLLISPGEPSVHPDFTDRVIWFAVLGFMGSLNSFIIYGISSFLARKD